MNFQVTIMAHKMMAFFIIIIIFWKINIIEKTPGNKDQNSFVFLMGVFPCYCDMQGFFFLCLLSFYSHHCMHGGLFSL
jgi:hypothetical protein